MWGPPWLASLDGGCRLARTFLRSHGLIIIVALGESIVAIGVGVAKEPISWVIIAASVLGLLLASALWWAYFDVSALLGEHALATEPPETRARLARNAYSFAHLPLVLGIVLVAFGLKEVLLYVSDSSEHSLTDPLPSVALAALVGGVVIYLLGHVVFKWLTVHTVSVVRLAAAGALLLTIPLIAGRRHWSNWASWRSWWRVPCWSSLCSSRSPGARFGPSCPITEAYHA